MAAITLAGLGSPSRPGPHHLALDAGASGLSSRQGSAGSSGQGSAGSSGQGSAGSSSHGSRAARSRPGVTPTAHPLGVSSAEVDLRSTLTKTLQQTAASGGAVGAVVDDVGDRAELFGLHTTVKRPPASVEKLWTTTAVMNTLGPDARLHTTVLGTGWLRDGVWHGDLYLRGGGDPTFGDPTFNTVWNHGYGPTANQLVDQLSRQGIHGVTGHLIADESLFDRRRGGMMTGLQADVPDFGGQLSALTYDHGTTAAHYDPATFAARELALTMRASHIEVRAAATTDETPSGAHLLALVASPPMATMTRLMDVPSDDLFAELFAKQLGVRFGAGGSIAGGAQVIARTIAAAYDLHPRILDGSGLSREDRSSPLEVVDLLDDVWHTRVGDELTASLPTVGVEGTVQGIGVKTAAQGRCVAKTGTLTDVTNLAGYCHSRGGHLLAFALFLDGPDNATATLELSKMLAAIARY